MEEFNINYDQYNSGIIYLAENTNTSKIINAAKLLKDVIPGL